MQLNNRNKNDRDFVAKCHLRPLYVLHVMMYNLSLVDAMFFLAIIYLAFPMSFGYPVLQQFTSSRSAIFVYLQTNVFFLNLRSSFDVYFLHFQVNFSVVAPLV